MRPPSHSPSQIMASALIFLSVSLMACGSDNPAEKLREAKEVVAEKAEDVTASEAAAEKSQSAFDDAREELDEANSELRKAKAELASAEADLRELFTDEELFREVQSRLLQDQTLSGVAIRAGIANGVVSLAGNVPDEKLRDRAIKIAQDTPGVVSVNHRISVDSAAEPTN